MDITYICLLGQSIRIGLSLTCKTIHQGHFRNIRCFLENYFKRNCLKEKKFLFFNLQIRKISNNKYFTKYCFLYI